MCNSCGINGVRWAAISSQSLQKAGHFNYKTALKTALLPLVVRYYTRWDEY
jgi:hypothetical protein